MRDNARKVPSRFNHPVYAIDTFSDYDGSYIEHRQVGNSLDGAYDPDANLVSSRMSDYPDGHSVMIDIDIPSALVPSSTDGHYHLYVDKVLTWRKYKRLLRALRNAGIIEEDYYRASVQRRATHLRLPGVRKR